MRKVDLTVGLSLVAVFASGAAVGAYGHRFYTARTVIAKVEKPRTSPEEYRRHWMNEMRSRLNLSEDQVAQLNVILDDAREQWRQFRARTKPESDAIYNSQVEKTRAILTPVQRAEYEEMRKEREMRRAKGRPGGC